MLYFWQTLYLFVVLYAPSLALEAGKRLTLLHYYYMIWIDEFSWYFNNFSLATSWGNERTIVVCGLCHYFFVYNTHRKQKLWVCKLKTVWQLTKWFELTSFRTAVVQVINFISKNLFTWNKNKSNSNFPLSRHNGL